MDSASGRVCCDAAAPAPARRRRSAVVPLLLQLVTQDVTVRVAAEQGVQASLTAAGSSALVTGGEASLSARAVGPESAYGLHARGLYGRIWGAPFGTQPATDSLSAELAAAAGLNVSP